MDIISATGAEVVEYAGGEILGIDIDMDILFEITVLRDRVVFFSWFLRPT